MQKKIFSTALSIALVCVMLTSLGACKGKTGSSSGIAKRNGPILDLPLSDGNTTFSLLLCGIGNLISSFDYADNAFTKRIVDETGIKLNIQGVSDTDYKTRLSVLLGSGDYPDLIMSRYSDVTLNDLIYFGNQGIFLPINDYNPLSYPNIKAAFDEYPAAYQRVSGPDGKMYSLPTVNDCPHCRFRSGRAVYYMPWIRDNGFKAPSGTDELLAYLRWVRDNDVNKNGNKNDEIPVAFCRQDIRTAISFIARSFMPFVTTDEYFGLALIDGKVTEQYKLKEYRDALTYFAGLYKEGLVLPDSFTMTREQLKALGGSPTPILAYAFTNAQGDAVPSGTERWVETFISPVLKGPTGQQNGPNKDPWSIINPGLIITDKCKDPELAVALYNYLLNFDVMLDGYIGPKGQAWDEPDAGTLSLMGETPRYKLLVGYGTQAINAGWNQYNPMIRNSGFRLGEQAKGADVARKWLSTGDPALLNQLVGNSSYNEEQNYFNTVDQLPYELAAKYFIPPLAMSEADTSRLMDINATLETYKEQAAVEFITGIRDISSEAAWNTYLADLDRMGSNELQGIVQKYVK
jgi:putative aldouronate transport system substrate-binding protein